MNQTLQLVLHTMLPASVGPEHPDRLQGKKRSTHWPRVRANHLKHQPECQVCGALSPVEVHHIEAFTDKPSRELDETNLITLCASRTHNCHLIFGHFLRWTRVNSEVVEMAESYRDGLEAAKIFVYGEARLD